MSYISTGNMVWLERYLHEAFAHRRVRGEWFNLSVMEVASFTVIMTADTVDNLPSTIAAQRAINEANDFQWGERQEEPPPPAWLPKLAEQVATRLRMARARSDKTLAEVGDATGVHAVTISKYENGKLPTLENLMRLASAYGVKTADLMPTLEEIST